LDNLKDIGFYTLSNERAKNVDIFSQMKRCEMIITEKCNFKCKYCRGLENFIYEDRKEKQLSFEEIKKNIDIWCFSIPLENIRFSGGEPTLHRDIKKIVEYSKQKGIKRIAISTNGSNNLELYKDLIKLGVNDFSISLDACCANDGDKIAGIKSWQNVVNNIKEISKLTYVTVGVVLNENNIGTVIDIVNIANDLGVSDIRLISAAQYNKPIEQLKKINKELKNKYPILNYRIKNFMNGKNVRGMIKSDSKKCALVLDDSIIAGNYHFPCVIYMREKGKPIGKVSEKMRFERFAWFKNHNSYDDKICKKNCLDVCIDYNNKYRELHKN